MSAGSRGSAVDGRGRCARLPLPSRPPTPPRPCAPPPAGPVVLEPALRAGRRACARPRRRRGRARRSGRRRRRSARRRSGRWRRRRRRRSGRRRARGRRRRGSARRWDRGYRRPEAQRQVAELRQKLLETQQRGRPADCERGRELACQAAAVAAVRTRRAARDAQMHRREERQMPGRDELKDIGVHHLPAPGDLRRQPRVGRVGRHGGRETDLDSGRDGDIGGVPERPHGDDPQGSQRARGRRRHVPRRGLGGGTTVEPHVAGDGQHHREQDERDHQENDDVRVAAPRPYSQTPPCLSTATTPLPIGGRRCFLSFGHERSIPSEALR